MKPNRRDIGALAVLFNRIVGGEKTCADNDCMKHGEGYEPPLKIGRYFHAEPLSVRIRGSAQKRSKSARKFPPTRKSVENRTPPTTTYRSRARMDSNNSGPSPGQLITTSMSSDPLSNTPMLKPNRDITGFAAAGSAYRYRRVRLGMPCPTAASRNGALRTSAMAART